MGTAAGTGSKVWYTVAGGVLSDVYEPTIDNTNVSTLQYVVTDGSTFSDMQARDMTYTVAADPRTRARRLGRRGRRPTPAPGTCGRSFPVSAPSPIWPKVPPAARSPCSRR